MEIHGLHAKMAVKNIRFRGVKGITRFVVEQTQKGRKWETIAWLAPISLKESRIESDPCNRAGLWCF